MDSGIVPVSEPVAALELPAPATAASETTATAQADGKLAGNESTMSDPSVTQASMAFDLGSMMMMLSHQLLQHGRVITADGAQYIGVPMPVSASMGYPPTQRGPWISPPAGPAFASLGPQPPLPDLAPQELYPDAFATSFSPAPASSHQQYPYQPYLHPHFQQQQHYAYPQQQLRSVDSYPESEQLLQQQRRRSMDVHTSPSTTVVPSPPPYGAAAASPGRRGSSGRGLQKGSSDASVGSIAGGPASSTSCRSFSTGRPTSTGSEAAIASRAGAASESRSISFGSAASAYSGPPSRPASISGGGGGGGGGGRPLSSVSAGSGGRPGSYPWDTYSGAGGPALAPLPVRPPQWHPYTSGPLQPQHQHQQQQHYWGEAPLAHGAAARIAGRLVVDPPPPPAPGNNAGVSGAGQHNQAQAQGKGQQPPPPPLHQRQCSALFAPASNIIPPVYYLGTLLPTPPASAVAVSSSAQPPRSAAQAAAAVAAGASCVPHASGAAPSPVMPSKGQHGAVAAAPTSLLTAHAPVSLPGVAVVATAADAVPAPPLPDPPLPLPPHSAAAEAAADGKGGSPPPPQPLPLPDCGGDDGVVAVSDAAATQQPERQKQQQQQQQQPPPPLPRLFLARIKPHVTAAEIRAYFNRLGAAAASAGAYVSAGDDASPVGGAGSALGGCEPVVDVAIPVDAATGLLRGIAFVSLASPGILRAILAHPGTHYIGGHPVVAEVAVPRSVAAPRRPTVTDPYLAHWLPPQQPSFQQQQQRE